MNLKSWRAFAFYQLLNKNIFNGNLFLIVDSWSFFRNLNCLISIDNEFKILESIRVFSIMEIFWKGPWKFVFYWSYFELFRNLNCILSIDNEFKILENIRVFPIIEPNIFKVTLKFVFYWSYLEMFRNLNCLIDTDNELKILKCI